MNRKDLEFFVNKKVEVAVPHLFLSRPYFYYGIIKRLTEENLTLDQVNKQGKHKGTIDIPIKNIIHVKSRNWEVVQ